MGSGRGQVPGAEAGGIGQGPGAKDGCWANGRARGKMGEGPGTVAGNRGGAWWQ